MQFGLAHLGNHGRGLGCLGVGVQRQKDRIVVAACGQPRLRIEHGGFAVVAAGGQARNAGSADRVVTLGAFNRQGAKLVQRPAVVVHRQAGLVGVAVNIGLAGLDLCGGVAAALQGAKAFGLCTVPAFLGEPGAGRQVPVAQQPLAPAGEVLLLGYGTAVVQCHIGHLGLYAGSD
ncbi:hypothetical protein D3C72_1307650 [compost metagenome]